MASNSNQLETVGVIGSGSFGTAVARLLSENVDVLLYCRNPEAAARMNNTKRHKDVAIPENILAVTSLKLIADQCNVIFPVVPCCSFSRNDALAIRPLVATPYTDSWD